MAFGVYAYWLDDEMRQMLKPIFGNYRNWVRYQEIVAQWRVREVWRPWTEGWRL